MIKLWFNAKPPYNLCFIKGALKIDLIFQRKRLLDFQDPSSGSKRHQVLNELKKHLHPDQLEELWVIFLREGYYERA